MKIIEVKQGKLEGYNDEKDQSCRHVVFYKIPYATPPIEEKRFKDPEPPVSWTGIRDSHSFKQSLEKSSFEEKMINLDDCLYLDVYVPCWTMGMRTIQTLNPNYPLMKNNIPVMVWFGYGGNFTCPYDSLKPKHLVNKDIVFVSVNYRLGALGFLNLGHEAVSGNQGMKDLIMALKWIQENIHAFYGDSKNVTIFGSNMGAVAAHLLMLSPLSKGLFHKAILQSGTATMKWSIMANEKLIENSFKLASILNINSRDPEEVLKSLQKISTMDIITAQYKILTLEEQRTDKQIFGPTVDKEAILSFLPEPVESLLSKEYDIPVIVGHTADECVRFIKDISPKTIKLLWHDLRLYVDKCTGKSNSDETTELIIKEIIPNYFNEKFYVIENYIQKFIRFLSDIHFNDPIIKYALNRLKFCSKRTFMYTFAYDNPRKIYIKGLYNTKNISGASHGDELSLLFDMNHASNAYQYNELNNEEKKIQEILVTMWTNFAKLGHPTFVRDKTYVTEYWPSLKEGFKSLIISKKLSFLDLPKPIID